MVKLAVIRDDDLSALNSPEDIIQAYRSLYGLVPINFFFVPCLKDPSLSYMAGENDYYWRGVNVDGIADIFENLELMTFLEDEINKGHIDVGLHGLHHYKRELERPVDKSQILEAISKANKILGRNIKSISAPNNSFSKKSENVIESLFKVVYISYSHRINERRFSASSSMEFIYAALCKLLGRPLSQITNSPRRINAHYEMSSIPISYVQDHRFVFKAVEDFLESPSQEVLCLATHFYDLKDNLVTYRLMEQTIGRLLDSGVKFVTLSEIEDRVMSKGQ